MFSLAIKLCRRYERDCLEFTLTDVSGSVERGTEGMTEIKFSARGINVYYGATHAIKDVDVDIQDKTVTAFIGPSGCGKSTFLRCLNRMNDVILIARVNGDIRLDGEDIYDRREDPVQLRAKDLKIGARMMTKIAT